MTLSPSDLNPRQDLFCRRILAGASAAEAARLAGYAPANAAHQGAALLADPRIRQRLEALRREAARVQASRTGALTAMLREVYAAAMEKGDLRAAVRCIETEAKLLGLLPGGAVFDPFLDFPEPIEPFEPADPQEPPQKPIMVPAEEFAASWPEEPRATAVRPAVEEPEIAPPPAAEPADARWAATPMDPHKTTSPASPLPPPAQPDDGWSSVKYALPCGGTVERLSYRPG